MLRFRPFSPPPPTIPSLLDQQPNTPARIAFDDDSLLLQKQSMRTAIRPEKKPSNNIGEQLERLINQPKPSIFGESKRFGLGSHKIVQSRSNSRQKQGWKEEEKLLQEISGKLNTACIGKQKEMGKDKEKMRTKPSLKRGQINPGTKMVFQRQLSLKATDFQLNNPGIHNMDTGNSGSKQKQVKSLNDVTEPGVSNGQQASDPVKVNGVVTLSELVKQGQVKSSKVEIINCYVPLYVQFFSISPKGKKSQEETELQEQMGDKSEESKEQNGELQTYPEALARDPTQFSTQTHQQEESQQELQTKQGSLPSEKSVEHQKESEQTVELKAEEQLPIMDVSPQKEDSFVEINFYEDIDRQNEEQTLPPVEQMESQQQPITNIAESIINQCNLQDSSSSITQQSKEGEEGENKEQCQVQSTDQVPVEDQFAMLERFIKENEQKFNNNLVQTNARREMQKEIQTFWDSNQQLEEEQLAQSDTKTVQLPITQQDDIPQKGPEISPSELKIDHFVKGKRLGKGMFGEVFVVVHKETGFICALKCLSKQFIKSQKMTQQLMQELKIHSTLNHPNIVQMYGYFSDEENVYVLQELCTGGQLFDLIVKRRRISERRAAYYMKQLAQGLRYLQTASIVHRDIKPENILIQQGVVKICDFGWAMFSLENQFSEKCGTPLYLSPEVVKGETYSDKVDVWGLGLITYELIIGNIPWNIWTEEDTSKIVTDDLVFPNYVSISNKAQDFIKKAMAKQPEERISLLESFTHDFLMEVNPMQYQNESFQSYGEATP